jgi:hypothetical protein
MARMHEQKWSKVDTHYKTSKGETKPWTLQVILQAME